MAFGNWALLLLGVSAAAGQVRPGGAEGSVGRDGGGTGPDYATAETRIVIEAMVEAHGGMERWLAVPAFRFRILSKVAGQANAWLSTETVEPATGRAYLDWPVLDASIVWDGEQVWSVNWGSGPPPGFFTRLSYSFVVLPFLTQQDGVDLGPPSSGKLPADSTQYRTVRMTFSGQNASIPGDYYELYIDPATHRLKAVGFNITHPGMIANRNQALGPIVHVFEEYAVVDGLTLPSYYVSFGFNPRNRNTSNAIHVVFDIRMNEPFDEYRMQRPSDAVTDHITMAFWN